MSTMLCKAAEKSSITDHKVPFILGPQKFMDEWSRILYSDYKHHVHVIHVEGMGDGRYSQVLYTMLAYLARKVKDTNRHHREFLLDNDAQTPTIYMLHDTADKLEGYLVASNHKISTMRTLLPPKLTASNHTLVET